MVHPATPYKTIKDIVDYAKKNPGKLDYGFIHAASGHMAMELFKQTAGLELTGIPYKGGGQAVGDVVGGQIPLVYTAIASAQQYVKSGRLKALGVSGAKRSSSLPDVPTFIESGLDGFVVDSWVGIFAPAKTSRAIVDRLQRELAAILALPEVRERYAVLGIEPVGNTSEQFGEQVRADLAKWEKVVKQANIKAE